MVPVKSLQCLAGALQASWDWLCALNYRGDTTPQTNPALVLNPLRECLFLWKKDSPEEPSFGWLEKLLERKKHCKAEHNLLCLSQLNCLDTTVMGNVPALKRALQAGISSVSHVS